MAILASLHHLQSDTACRVKADAVMTVQHGVRLESIRYGDGETMTNDTSYLDEIESLPAGLCDALASDDLTPEQKADYRRLVARIKRRIRNAREEHNHGLPAELSVRPENPFGVET